MSFLPKEPTTFINIKLTDEGRRLLSLGALRFEKTAFSDREIDYSLESDGINLTKNRVLSPKDTHPSFSNLDGSNYINISSQSVDSVKQYATGSTNGYGFFTGSDNNLSLDTGAMLGRMRLTYDNYDSLPSGGTSIVYDAGTATVTPKDGMLLYIPWEPIQNSGKTYVNDTLIYSSNPTNHLWYRIKSADTVINKIELDRPLPDFGTTTTNQSINAYMYPSNGAEGYYGSASTVETKIWGMNIVRTSNVVGTDSSISGYTTYGSIEYAGSRKYLGFSSDTRQVGIVHYTNNYTGNTYAEQLIERSVKIDLPNIMWHKHPANTGEAKDFGLKLYDRAGETVFDRSAQTSYRFLRDGTSSSNRIVGRVYHKLKIIAITDPELLTALTYKSNRNYTLPKLDIGYTSNPKYPLSNSDANGLIKEGKTYFVSYVVDNERPYQQGVSFGYPKPLHCNYISKIEGELDADNNNQYLVAGFPRNSFPYLRNSANMSSNSIYSGTGWNANYVQLLVKEVDSNLNYDINTVPSEGWKLMSSGYIGNGVYTGDTGDTTIDPLKLQNFDFIVSQEDYNSGTTYTLDSAFTQNNDFADDGLTFGNESFFFGNISSGIRATTFKTVITALADNTRFNSTNNTSFDESENSSIYITEVGVFNENNSLVAVGKPTYPIKKNNGRFLGIQLEIDF